MRNIEKSALRIARHRYFEDRLQYSAEDLQKYYRIRTTEDAQALYERLHELAAMNTEQIEELWQAVRHQRGGVLIV